MTTFQEDLQAEVDRVVKQMLHERETTLCNLCNRGLDMHSIPAAVGWTCGRCREDVRERQAARVMGRLDRAGKAALKRRQARRDGGL